jgi:alpha-tubulin suppressor-like RCC1 family protein
VPGLSGVVALAAGSDFNCALTVDERVLCWGGNDSGQLGDGTTKMRAKPEPVVELTGAKEIHASSGEGGALESGGQHACARVGSGAVYCWGSNRFGELGLSKSVLATAVPLHDAELSAASAIVLGFRDTCRIDDGRLACRGASGFGDGVASLESGFQEVEGFDGATVVSIGAGFIHAKFSGVAHAWGDNGAGQLCLGTRRLPVASSTIPLQSRLQDVEDLAAGGEHICALDHDGRVYCCGDNQLSQTGPDPTGEAPVLEPAPGESTLALTGGDNHACVLIAKDDRREIRCWGSNANGQLGDGTTLQRIEPVSVQWLLVNDG